MILVCFCIRIMDIIQDFHNERRYFKEKQYLCTERKDYKLHRIMKKLANFFLCCLMFFSASTANAGENLTLKDLTNGVYSPKYIRGIRPMKGGDTYTQLSTDGRKVTEYTFKDGKQVRVLFDLDKIRDTNIKSIDNYIISPDGKKMLIETEHKPIYRRSYTGVFYIYRIGNTTMDKLSEGGPQQCPKFSPNSDMVAFVRDNNLFLVKLLFNNSESQVTKDGKRNEIINGLPDWVNEEEFEYNTAFDFSSDSQMLAWIRFDESKVKEFTFPLYEGSYPDMKQYATYPGTYSYKYPVAGEDNSKVSVKTYDIKAHVTRTMNVPLDADGYIPRIQFTKVPDKLMIMTLNRHQDRFDVYMGNARSTVCQQVLRDNDSKYINTSAYEQFRIYPQNFAYVSEKDGRKHLYWYSLNGSLIKKVTTGDFDVLDFYGWNPADNSFYYASNEGSPLRKGVYKITLNGKKTLLTTAQGMNEALFSDDYSYFINTYSSLNTPPVVSLKNNEGKTIKVLQDNADLKQKLANVNMGKKEFFSFKTSEGVTLNGWMIKPSDFNSNKKYPVIMFQYSGPGNQQVLDQWNIGNMTGGLYETFLAENGCIAVCVDGRGTGGRGAEFEKCTYLNLGQKESKDQVEAAIYLGNQPYVDKNNIAIWGWSYGGFNTLMSMSEGRPVFKCGVAVAPPTSYRFYDTVYTERYMRTPKENAAGYNDNPITRADKLHGSLLICHGLADDNVHFSNTAEYSEALVQKNIPFEMQLYTNRNHGIFGGNTRLHLFNRITSFMFEHLK